MTEAGERLIEGAKEALAIARGEQPAARLHIGGHAYVPVSALKFLEEQNEALMQERSNILATHRGRMERERSRTGELVAKAKTLVDAVGHDNNGSMVAGRYVGGNGGLYSTETIKTADALRLELDRWK